MPDEDIASLRKSLLIYRGLVEVSALINSITDFDDLLKAILGVARRVMNAEAASLFFTREEAGDLDLVISSYEDGKYLQPRITVPSGQGIAGWVLAHGEPLLIPDAYADPRFYREADKATGFRTRSILCAPLLWEKSVIGVLQVLNPNDKPAFEPEDVAGFHAYSTLIATAIEKLRSIERIRKQERVERDLAIAAEIQGEVLSRAIPSKVEGLVFASYNQPAQNVGGDFYLVSPRNAYETYFAIGDVSGKGIPASLLMAQTMSAMQFVFAATTSPSEALAKLNATLSATIVRGMFVTTLIGRFTAGTNRVEIASAGHCRPLVVRRDGTVSEVPTEGALPLGVMPNMRYRQIKTEMSTGDLLLSFTDGLTESRNPISGQYFEECIAATASAATRTAAALVEALVCAEKRHRDGDHARDDLTILAGGYA